jgi:hypothetical protein
MDGSSSSDDEEIKHIQNHIDYKTNKKRKEVPPASIPEHLESEQIQNVNINHVEIHESEPQASNSSRRNRDNVQNMNFPWLELVGPTCHSVKQSKGGVDLSHIKRKYRNMRCLTCAQHNPSTPWAELWPRKFELQTLVDHAKSGAHIKSETAQKSMPDYIPTVDQPSVFKVVSGSGKALQLDKSARDDPQDPSIPASEAFTDLGDDPNADKVSVRIRGVLNAGGAHIIAHSTRVRPDWLYSEGPLCLSDKQMSDPGRPQGTKKKYKQMACLYCREYVPDSMWAHLRPRKYESAVIGDHERSAVHQKAVELRHSQMGGGGEMEIAHLEAMRSAQELLRSSNETIKFSEY